MRLNTKNLISGGIFILVALIGLWLNTDHSLGSARRMGPGYMPMLAYSLLAFLGLAVFIGGLFDGPDDLDKWTKLEILCVPLAVVAFFLGYFAASATGMVSSRSAC